MKSTEITRAYPFYKQAKKLMSRAFPAYEQLPWNFLRFMSLRRSIHFEGFEDKGKFVGFAYQMISDQAVYVQYLAVNPACRCHGYGSRILTTIEKENPDKPLALDIEPVVKTAPNYTQRRKRLAFYKSNGFHETGVNLVENEKKGIYYSVLTTAKHFSTKKCSDVLGKLSFGLLTPKLIVA